MRYYMGKQINYEKIIQLLCEYKGIKREELYKILKDKECKYLLFLLMKKYNCIDAEVLNRDFSIKTRRCITNNIKEAEEKLLINKKIRELYFEAEELIENK